MVIRKFGCAVLLILTGGCGSFLPPIERTPLSVTDGAKCYGLHSAFRYRSDDFDYAGSWPLNYPPSQYPFLWTLGFVGVSRQYLAEDPAYVRLSFLSPTSELRVDLLSNKGEVVHQLKFPGSLFLECGPTRTELVVPTAICPSWYGCTAGNRRATVVFTSTKNGVRVASKRETEAHDFGFRSMHTSESWAIFAPVLLQRGPDAEAR